MAYKPKEGSIEAVLDAIDNMYTLKVHSKKLNDILTVILADFEKRKNHKLIWAQDFIEGEAIQNLINLNDLDKDIMLNIEEIIRIFHPKEIAEKIYKKNKWKRIIKEGWKIIISVLALSLFGIAIYAAFSSPAILGFLILVTLLATSYVWDQNDCDPYNIDSSIIRNIISIQEDKSFD